MPRPSTGTQEVIAHIDGGSRGNPGPAAYAVVIDAADGTRLATLSRSLGVTTNNVAEYEGLLAALDCALERNYRRLKIISDSELLVRQITGRYKVKNPNLQVLHSRARALIAQLDAFHIQHVRREYNREADRLANEAMDAARRSKKLPQIHSAAQAHSPSKTGLGGTPRALRATAVYRQGVLELETSLPLGEGEQVDLEIHRRET